MKHLVLKYCLFAFFFLLTVIVITFAFYVKYSYMNAEGQKRAICLARALVSLHEKEKRFPSDFLRETSFFFSDRRNVRFELHIKGESDFEIEYRPHSVWVFQLSKTSSQVLKIKWNQSMKDIQIESSIETP